jgi:hypothetical protein
MQGIAFSFRVLYGFFVGLPPSEMIGIASS